MLGLPVASGGGETSCISFLAPESDELFLSETDIADTGGGTVGYYWGFDRYGLSKSIDEEDVWTAWFIPPEGTFTQIDVRVDLADPLTGGAPSAVVVELVRDDDGVVTVIASDSLALTEVGFGNIGAFGSFAVDETFGPPAGYQNFWAGFEKTRENPP